VLLTFPGSQAIREKLQQPGQGKNLIAGTKAGVCHFPDGISIEFGERNSFFFWNILESTLNSRFFFFNGWNW